MSRIGTLLQRLQKSAAPIGFGSLREGRTQPRMLLMAHVIGSLPQDDMNSVADCADAIAVAVDMQAARLVRRTLQERERDIPSGLWIEGTETLPQDIEFTDGDFVVVDLDGPSTVLFAKDAATLIRVPRDIASARLRAIGELGIEAVLLDGREMDLSRVASYVECRRVRSGCRRPVLLEISRTPETESLASLWRSGVDGLVLSTAHGASELGLLREAIDSTPFGIRPAIDGGTGIRAVGVTSRADAEEAVGDDDGEDEDE